MLDKLEQIKQREVSRKEFLAIVGLSMVSIFGLSDILRILMGKSSHSDLGTTYSSDDYGG